MGMRFSFHSLASKVTAVEDSSQPSELPLPNSEESIVNLSLSDKNGVYHFFRRTGEIVSKCVHQGEPKFKMAVFLRKSGHLFLKQKFSLQAPA